MLDAPLFWAAIGVVALIALSVLLSRRRGHDPSARNWSGFGRKAERPDPTTDAAHIPLSARTHDPSGLGGGGGG